MLSSALLNRLKGYRRRIVHEYSMWDYRRRSERNLRNYKVWAEKIRRLPPDVLVGPDLLAGGVRGHVHAIQKYSSLKVQLVPDEVAMGGLGNFTAEIVDHFMAFEPIGSPAVHSHVLPWMIDWCGRQQERGLRWVHTYHNMYFPEFAVGELAPWQLKINQSLIHEACLADVRLSVARWQQQYLRAEHGIETDYLPNGVDVQVCDRGRANRFRRRHNLKGKFVLYVGRNDPVKNPADFVQLAQRIPRLTLAMVGPGMDRGVMRTEWNLESPPNLHFLGAASHVEVQDALAACSVLVVTSKREGLPTLVLEAMAHQKPVVVAAEAGCMEAIANGEFGSIYRQGDIDDLAAKVELVLTDPSLRPLSRQRVLAEYDWRVVAPKLDAIYQGGRSA